MGARTSAIGAIGSAARRRQEPSAEHVGETYAVVVIREEDGRYSAFCPALDGAGSFGETIPEALRMAEEDISLYIETRRELGWPVPADSSSISFDMGEAQEAHIYKMRVPLPEAPSGA